MVDESLQWQLDYAHILDELGADARRHVVSAIQSNVIEGWNPTEADIRGAVDHALGRSTVGDLLAPYRQKA